MFNIILTGISFIFITFSLIGYGTLVYNIKKNQDLFFIIIVGYFIVGFVGLIIHFFFSISDAISIFLILLGIFLFFSKFKFFKKEIFASIIILISVSFLLLGYSDHPIDANMYHHPYVSYLKSEKIIFSIANIEFRFGHISLLQYVQSIFTNNFFGPLAISSLNIIFFTFFLLYCYETLFSNSEDKFVFLVVLLVSCFVLIKMGRYREFGNDLIPFLVSFYFLIKLLQEKISKKNNLNFSNLIYLPLYSSFMLSHKISYIFSVLIFILVINRSNIKLIFNNRSLIFIFISFTSLWLLKNYIETSCLVYPVVQTCLKNSGWYLTGIADPEKAMWLSEIWSKGFIDHPNWKNLDLSNYSKDFNWLSVWINNHFIKILEKLSPIFILLFLISFYMFFKVKHVKNNVFKSSTNLSTLVITLILISFGLGIWFFKSPLFRYGSFYVVSFVIFFYLILSHKIIIGVNKVDLQKLKIFFFISIIFFVTKNINRQINSESKFLPSTKLPIESYEMLFTNPKIYKPKKGSCYYTDFICSHEVPVNAKISKKNNFYIIN